MRDMATMRKLLLSVLAALLVAVPARAQDLRALNKAVEDYNGGKYQDAALAFFDVAENSGEPELGYRAEYYLALSLYKLGFFHSALYYDKLIIEQGPNHPYYGKAIESMLEVMDSVGDKAFIPNILDKEYNEAFAKLPPAVIDRINFLVALWSHQQTKVDEAAEFLEFVPKESASYPRARYLVGVQAAEDAVRSGADKKHEEAAKIFLEVLDLKPTEKAPYPGLAEVKELATIALARVRYAQGKFAEAAETYDRVPRFARHWRDALFESAYAHFMNDETGKALGKLHTLHAPVAGDQLVPESWLLKAHIYYFACLFEESKAALAYMQKVYPAAGQQVKAMLEAKREPEFYYGLVAQGEKGGSALPAMVRNELLTDETLRGRRNYILALEGEAKKLKELDAWKKTDLQGVLVEVVEQQRNLFVQVAGKTVLRLLRKIEILIDDIDGQAEIVKFEMAKREKDLLESGFKSEKRLASQPLYRPEMPRKGVEYWDFEGEFWPDELGFYQYTVKNACPVEETAEAK